MNPIVFKVGGSRVTGIVTDIGSSPELIWHCAFDCYFPYATLPMYFNSDLEELFIGI